MTNLVHVPTVTELAAKGLAHERGGFWTLTPEGQQIVYDAMAHNAAAAKADRDLQRLLEHEAAQWGPR